MAKTDSKTKDKTTEAPQPQPPVQPPAKIDRTTWQGFEAELSSRENEIASLLPQHVSAAKFHACAVAAVKQNPELLECNLRSLFQAITRSAQDGILPDGREGVINIYNTKISKPNEKTERWGKMAQWNPMAHGLRKRARELDHMLIDAQVVYENDKLVWVQGDEPKIEHYPPKLGEPRGEMIGAYAIFKREDGTILAREVMAKGEIEKVQEQSKSKDGLMWKKFTGEAWRKTVIRRGIKSVPVSEPLQEIVRRDDEDFDFSHDGAKPAIEGVITPPRPRESEFQRKTDPAKGDPKLRSEPDGRPEPPPIGEAIVIPPESGTSIEAGDPIVSQEQNDEPEPEPEPQPEPETEPEEEQPPTESFMGAMNLMDKMEEAITSVKELDEFKKEGRINIDKVEALTDDERDMLRGRFTTMVLAEQKRRANRGRR